MHTTPQHQPPNSTHPLPCAEESPPKLHVSWHGCCTAAAPLINQSHRMPQPSLKAQSSRHRAALLAAAAAAAVVLAVLLRTPSAPTEPAPQPPQPQVPQEELLYPLWWAAPFYTGSGYGAEAISFVSALLQTGRMRPADVWISHSGDHVVQHAVDSLDGATRQLLQAQEHSSLVAQGRLTEAELHRPAIAVCHSFPDCWAMPGDGLSMNVPGCPCPSHEAEDGLVVYRIGRTMFESAGLPAHLAQHCNAIDEVWVPTEFNRQTFIGAGVAADKIRVVPQGVDTADFDPTRHQPLLLRELPSAQLVIGSDATSDAGNATASQAKPFVFLSIFKFEARKGWDVLLDAYLQAFDATAEQPVELHIITKPFEASHQTIADQMRTWLVQRSQPAAADPAAAVLPKVYIHTTFIDDATYRRLYASADCVVLPSRGEGWGRPQIEAMSMALPVITTNWSGPTAYINSQVAYPLSYDGISEASSVSRGGVESPYFSGQQWAQPSVQHLRELLREVHAHPAEAAAKGRAARQHVLAHFSLDALASVVVQEVLRIQQKLGPDRQLPTAEERAVRRQQRSVCHTHPYLCSQGPGAAGIGEAARHAYHAAHPGPNFAHYHHHAGAPPHHMQHAGFGAAHAAAPGSRMTVQELLARAREADRWLVAGAGATN